MNDVDLQPNQLGRDFGKPVRCSPSSFYRDVPAFDVTELAESPRMSAVPIIGASSGIVRRETARSVLYHPLVSDAFRYRCRQLLKRNWAQDADPKDLPRLLRLARSKFEQERCNEDAESESDREPDQ